MIIFQSNNNVTSRSGLKSLSHQQARNYIFVIWQYDVGVCVCRNQRQNAWNSSKFCGQSVYLQANSQLREKCRSEKRIIITIERGLCGPAYFKHTAKMNRFLRLCAIFLSSVDFNLKNWVFQNECSFIFYRCRHLARRWHVLVLLKSLSVWKYAVGFVKLCW